MRGPTTCRTDPRSSRGRRLRDGRPDRRRVRCGHRRMAAHTASWPRVLAAVETRRHVSPFLQASEGPLPGSSGGTISPRASASVTRVRRWSWRSTARSQFSFASRAPRWSEDSSLRSAGLPMAPSCMRRQPVSAESRLPDRKRSVSPGSSSWQPRRWGVPMISLGPSRLGRRDEALRRLPQALGCLDGRKPPTRFESWSSEFVRRARLFLREGARDIQEHLADHPDERLPALLVACGSLPQRSRRDRAFGSAGPDVRGGGTDHWLAPLGADLHGRA